jgi:hypothetical protein
MKNVMGIVFVLTILSVLSGCMGLKAAQVTGAPSADTPSLPAPTGPSSGGVVREITTAGCTATVDVSGAMINCSDGSSAHVDKGIQGVQGVQGPAGPLSVLKLVNGDGNPVGDYLMSGYGSGYYVWDEANNVGVTYAKDGTPATGTLYYTTPDCSGTAYANDQVPVNTVFWNRTSGEENGQFYQTLSATIDNSDGTMIQASIATGHTCVSPVPGNDWHPTFSQVVAYTNGSIPAYLTLPVRIIKE